jgi:translocator protein
VKKRGSLLGALAACVLFAIFGGALVGEGLEGWYEALEKPWFLVPLRAFYAVGVLYYLAFAAVLYRILVHVEDRRARGICLALALVVMLFNELWNYLFFDLRSTLAGFRRDRVVPGASDRPDLRALQAREGVGEAACAVLSVGAL